MKTKITINHSGFHGRSSRNIVVDGAPGDRVELTASQIRKLSRAACGMADCTCGETLLGACEIREIQDGAHWYPTIRAWITIPDDGEKIDLNGQYA